MIDGKGLTLTPGLIDGFAGIGLPPAAPRAAPERRLGRRRPPAASPLAAAAEALALDRVRPPTR